MRTALKSYELGEINFYQFVSSYETAVQIQIEYFENIYGYNVSTSEIMYFSK
jgi:cobalt-zinc-cadmium resistance protein CzcA